ncbi:MAG: alpha/beta hydrolase, partial [Candidatus Binataceae bacterium]
DTRAGDWILACPREFEANVFSIVADPSLWTAMGSLPLPVKLICGDPDLVGAMPPALIGRELAREHGLPYESIPGTTHFLQIEKPEECALAMESFLGKYDLSAR